MSSQQVSSSNLNSEPTPKRTRFVQEVGTGAGNSLESSPIESDQKRQLARSLIQLGYEPMNTKLFLVPELQDPVLATPRPGSYPRVPKGKELSIFLNVTGVEVFEHIAQQTSNEMDKKMRMGEVTGQNASRYYSEKVEKEEIMAILGLQILFRGRANISSLEEQFKCLPPGLLKWPITLKRYNSIISSLSCDFGLLSHLLRNNWQSCIIPGKEFTVDETLYSFHSRVKGDSPQRYIPRKPHPNGLLSYMAAFKTKYGPYIFDLEPDYQIAALNPRTAMERIIHRWVWKIKPHCVVDAGFSGEDVQAIVRDLGCLMTSSINTAHQKDLFCFLSTLCPLDSWLALRDKVGTIWSVKRDDEPKKIHFIASNAFTSGHVTKKNPIMNETAINNLSKIGMRALVILAGFLNLEIQGDVYQMAHLISDRINSIEQINETSHLNEINESENEEESVDNIMTPTNLKTLRVPALKQKARHLGIRVTNKSKEDLIEAILEAEKINSEDIIKFIDEVRDSTNQGYAPHHDKYREVFNGVDLHDKKWYKLQNHHTIISWRSKFTLSMLQSSLINSFIFYRHFENVKLISFAEKVGVELCNQVYK